MNIRKAEIGATSLAVLAAGLFITGCAANGSAGSNTQVASVHCYGINACKGHNDCKTANNACKGHGSCKGQGFLVLSKTECSSRGGSEGA